MTSSNEYIMMTSSNGNIFHVTGLLCGEFTSPRWILRTKASNEELWSVLWYLRLNKRLSKYSWGWWSETPSRPLWRLCNEVRSYCFSFFLGYIMRLLLFHVIYQPITFKYSPVAPEQSWDYIYLSACKETPWILWTTTKHDKVQIVCIFLEVY